MGVVRMEEYEVSDEQLVQETLAGSREAFQVLVERHHRRIFGMARHYLRGSAEVEDLVQDSFLKAFSRLETFQSQSSFYTWLYRITKNTILDYLKRKGRSPVRNVEDPEENLGGVPEGRSGHLPRPDAQMMKSEVVEITRAVLEELPDIFPRRFGPAGAGGFVLPRDRGNPGDIHRNGGIPHLSGAGKVQRQTDATASGIRGGIAVMPRK